MNNEFTYHNKFNVRFGCFMIVVAIVVTILITLLIWASTPEQRLERFNARYDVCMRYERGHEYCLTFAGDGIND
jgi:hypothetical protein